MGKYERKDIELMEKSVALVLMNKNPLISSQNKWYRHMVAFADFIKKNFPDFKQVEYIGNKYGGTRGDLLLVKDNGLELFIELKASETPKGKGTLANISQDAITEYNLVLSKKRILSWSEFRRKKRFKKSIEKLLNKYKYPHQMDFETKARFIRYFTKKADKKAVKIKELIFKLTKLNKKEYINYIRKFQTNEENLKKFIYCMKNGIHVKKDIFDFIKKTKIKDLQFGSEELITLYANLKDNDKVKVTRFKNKTPILFKNYNNFNFSFPNISGEIVNTYVVAKDKKTKKEEKIINLVFHWKNVFQGIKTPCINVFLGSFW